MTDVLPWLLAVPAAYLIGSIPFGVIAGRLFTGVDIRSYGSGSTGATNVARTSGKRVGLLVLALDIGKGILAVGLVRIVAVSTVAESLASVFVVAGHNWPIFTGFQGGKGVSAGLGALGMLSPYAAVTTVIGPLVTVTTKYVSLGSMLATLASSILLIVQVTLLDYADEGYLIFAFAGFVLIIWQHRTNILRLARGEEHRFGARVEVKGAVAGER